MVLNLVANKLTALMIAKTTTPNIKIASNTEDHSRFLNPAYENQPPITAINTAMTIQPTPSPIFTAPTILHSNLTANRIIVHQDDIYMRFANGLDDLIQDRIINQ
ncbi:MAG: hypothetical protein NTZ34_07490 [Chloroflexi bacterium]|nr:hypothetical protein [Chloroflexota bacterium]